MFEVIFNNEEVDFKGSFDECKNWIEDTVEKAAYCDYEHGLFKTMDTARKFTRKYFKIREVKNNVKY